MRNLNRFWLPGLRLQGVKYKRLCNNCPIRKIKRLSYNKYIEDVEFPVTNTYVGRKSE